VTASERISAERRIAAPAAAIFRIISDPQGQVEIDGSGMLVAASPGHLLTKVGDTFEMAMDREPLGDVPLGRYDVVNSVTRIALDRQLEWTVAWPGSPPFGHVYGYVLTPVDAEVTDVCSYCDWTGLSPDWKGHITFPVIPATMLERSLENLARIVSEVDRGG
jgi:hypothetical protein